MTYLVRCMRKWVKRRYQEFESEKEETTYERRKRERDRHIEEEFALLSVEH